MELYKPVKSNRKNKKYMVLTKSGVIHFGDKRYEQFKDKIGVYKHLDHNDPKRREFIIKDTGIEIQRIKKVLNIGRIKYYGNTFRKSIVKRLGNW